MNVIKKVLAVSPYLLAMVSVVLPVSVALAATPQASPVQNATDIQNLLCSIVAWFIWIVILVSVIMVVYAAFQYATAGDDTEKVATGRKTLTYAAVGIIVALCAAGFPSIVETVFPQSTTYSIPCLGGGANANSNGTGG